MKIYLTRAKTSFLFLFLILNTIVASAAEGDEEKIGRKGFETVILDLKTGIITPRELPFDVPFYISGEINQHITSVQIFYRVNPNDCSEKKSTDNSTKCNKCEKCATIDTTNWEKSCVWKRNYFNKDSTTKFNILIPALEANEDYEFCISAVRKPNASEQEKINSVIYQNLFKSSLSDYSNKLNLEEFKNKLFINQALKVKFEENLKSLYPKANIAPDFLSNLIFNTEFARLFYEANQYHSTYAGYKKISEGLMILSANTLTKSILAKSSELESYPQAYTFLRKIKNAAEANQLNNSVDLGINNLEKRLFQFDSIGFDKINDRTIGKLIVNLEEQSTELRSTSNFIVGLRNNKVVLEKKLFKDIDDNEIQKTLLAISNTLNYYSSQLDNLYKLRTALNLLNTYKSAFTAYCQEILDDPITIPFDGTTLSEFKTRGEYYFTADFGFAMVQYGKNFEYRSAFIPYYGVNINLTPLNRQAKYSLFRKTHPSQSCCQHFFKSTSIVLGLTVNTIANTERYNLWTDKNFTILSGLGFRLNDYLRLSGGVLWSRQKNGNPYITQTSLAISPYLSLSVDLDFGNFFNLVKSKIFI